MDTSKHSGRGSNRALAIFPAFSLVEVTLAIGIVASVVVVVVGMLPSGINTFRQAMNTSVGGQIAQQLLSEAQQTDFDVLVTPPAGQAAPGTNGTFTKPERYFDDQGSEIVPATAGAPTSADKQKIVYWVRTRVSPTTDLPSRGPAGETTNSNKLATVIIQIANNPASLPLAQETGATDDSNYPLRNLWSGAYVSDPANTKIVQNTIYSTLVGRNQ